MDTGDLVPLCGSMKRYRKRGSYDRLKSMATDNENVQFSMSEARPSKFRKVRLIPRFQPKIRLAMNLLKRFRDAYEESMLSFAEHVSYLSNRDFYFEMKKINPG
ncbi:hypothetical protein O6P43_008534 [Quillaja saponaria]|uniref:Uncharacterized protein n=1 Tax=Quillaja saponaria TaxID=32244 RepID=A0AAD7PW05_QUISA|nr:hypothetical protein O6P43_008534 [Quillaja saponaria]